MAHELLPTLDCDGPIVRERRELTLDDLFQLVGLRHPAEDLEILNRTPPTMNGLFDAVDDDRDHVLPVVFRRAGWLLRTLLRHPQFLHAWVSFSRHNAVLTRARVG